MPRTRRHVRTRKSRSSSSTGPSIVDLYGRNDASESEPLVDGPTSPSSGEMLAPAPKSSTQQNEEEELSEESDDGWSEDNDMSSELGFSLSLSSSGNTNDEEGTITTRGTSANLENNDCHDQYCLDDEEEDADIGFHSDNDTNGQRSKDSSSSSDDSSAYSRTSSARSESVSESSGSSKGQSDASQDRGQDKELEAKADDFFASAFADDQDLIPMETQINTNATKVRMFSTVDDFIDRDKEFRREAARRFSLNDRAVFRLIDGASAGNIDCAASDPGWGRIKAEHVNADRRHSFDFHKSFDEDDFETLEWQDDNSGGENRQRHDQEVPRVVSADSSDNQDIDYGYGYDDDNDGLRDHTRNYDSRYDRDLSELVSSQTDRNSRGEEYDSDEDSGDNNTYMNRSVASYISADNSSRSQPDPFLKPDVGHRPPTPPSPVKKSPPKPDTKEVIDQDVDDMADHYHGLPMSPNLEYNNQDEISTSSGRQHSSNEDHFQQDDGVDEFRSDFNGGFHYEQEHEHNGESFMSDEFFADELPKIDENNPVHHDYRRNGSSLNQHEKSEIPFGNQSTDILVRKQQRDRKLILMLAAGLGCALLALASVLGGVVAAAIVRHEEIQVVGTSPQASFTGSSPSKAPSQPPQKIRTMQPSKQPTRRPSTLAPRSARPTPSPSKSPITNHPTKSPIRQTMNPTISITLAPTSRATFGFGAAPSPTPPPTEFSGFGVARIP